MNTRNKFGALLLCIAGTISCAGVNSLYCRDGVCDDPGKRCINGMCLPRIPGETPPAAATGAQYTLGEKRYNQRITYGHDCVLVIPMIIRPTTNEAPGCAERDTGKEMCREGDCTSSPTVVIYPPCKASMN